jgi:predicted small metal-binding protein
MQRIVRCNCGAEIRSDNERDLIEQVQQHAKSAHDLDLTAEQVLAMMEIEQ